MSGSPHALSCMSSVTIRCWHEQCSVLLLTNFSQFCPICAVHRRSFWCNPLVNLLWPPRPPLIYMSSQHRKSCACQLELRIWWSNEMTLFNQNGLWNCAWGLIAFWEVAWSGWRWCVCWALLTVRFMTYLSQFLTEYGRATFNYISRWGTWRWGTYNAWVTVEFDRRTVSEVATDLCSLSVNQIKVSRYVWCPWSMVIVEVQVLVWTLHW